MKASKVLKAILLQVFTEQLHSTCTSFLHNCSAFQHIWFNVPKKYSILQIKCFRLGLKQFLRRFFSMAISFRI